VCMLFGSPFSFYKFLVYLRTQIHLLSFLSSLPLSLPSPDISHRRRLGHFPRSQQIQTQWTEGMQLAKHFWWRALEGK